MSNTRECFESRLAAEVLANPNLFPAVNKLSQLIIALLEHPTNVAFLKIKPVMRDEVVRQLYSNTHFGTLGGETTYCPTQVQFINDVINALKMPIGDLPKTLHLHQIFMQSLYESLPFKSDVNWLEKKNALVKVLFESELFNTTSRIKTGNEGVLTNQVGYGIDCDLDASTHIHRSIQGVFEMNPDSYWGRLIRNYKLPFLAGPSGHMGSGLMLAVLVGNFNPEELKQYVTAHVGILTGGGYHTVHEILSVANKLGIPYQPGSYHHFLPANFLTSLCIKRLESEFPEYISANVCEKFAKIRLLEILSSAVHSASHGAIQGFSNVANQVAVANGASPQQAWMIKNSFLYTGIFALQWYLSPETGLPSLLQASSATLDLALMDYGFKQITTFIESLQKNYANDYPLFSKVGNVCKGLASVSIFAKYANQIGVPQLAAVSLAGAAAKVGVEVTLQAASKKAGLV